ncbi:hypothetical protein WG947_00740 [Pontibacter sp. H259]|uniref:hypothetical protein n=1 Tax=Pontibacter sp. H259 TaxID=3133421 RepID=UPI0030C3A11F
MLNFPKKVNSKVILVAPILLGFYLAIMLFLHGTILAFLFYRIDIRFTNEYPALTAFLLYIATIPLAIILNKLLLKRGQSYDEKLTAGLSSNFAYNLTIALLFGFGNGSIGISFVILLVLSFFGFILAALITILIEKVETMFLNYKSSQL